MTSNTNELKVWENVNYYNISTATPRPYFIQLLFFLFFTSFSRNMLPNIQLSNLINLEQEFYVGEIELKNKFTISLFHYQICIYIYIYICIYKYIVNYR